MLLELVDDLVSEVTLHLISALVIGALIGIERTFSGRPAGFRTHVLVCMASSLLMMMSLYQPLWQGVLPQDVVRTDPTRMAQGIMTGIGFLGAGVIFKEGLTVRGLTTAASIWMTAAIGVLLGVGFYLPGILAAVLTLATLSVLRVMERWIPNRHHAENIVRCRRDAVLPEPQVRELLAQAGCRVLKVGYSLSQQGEVFEYRMVIRTIDKASYPRLSKALMSRPEVLEFRVSPMAD